MNKELKLPGVQLRPWGQLRPRTKAFLYPVIENITVPSIGHAFGQIPGFLLPGSPALYVVLDFLIDQSQSTGGGAALSDPIQFDLTQGSGFKYIISAAGGKRFHVELPPEVNNIGLALDLGHINIGTPSVPWDYGSPATIIFEGLIGPLPIITYNQFLISQQSNLAFQFIIEGEVTSTFEFEKLVLYSYFLRTFDPGTKSYEPFSSSVPLGTKDIWPKHETSLLFWYRTQNNVDPGRFVTIV